MQYAAFLQLLAVALPAFLAFSTKLISGKKRFIIAIAAYFILRKWAVAAAIDKANGSVGNGSNGTLTPEALATSYKFAMNPSGFDFLMSSDGTDEDELMELAAKSKGRYTSVYNAYYTLYKSDLTKTIMGELSPTDYKRFLAILNA
jgi:hypothetical protein